LTKEIRVANEIRLTTKIIRHNPQFSRLVTIPLAAMVGLIYGRAFTVRALR
jgi:hypothetical protein